MNSLAIQLWLFEKMVCNHGFTSHGTFLEKDLKLSERTLQIRFDKGWKLYVFDYFGRERMEPIPVWHYLRTGFSF